MMLTHILTVCHTTAFPVLRKESKKRKQVTLRQKGNRHGWRIRGQSLGRNDMSHSQKAGFDTLAKASPAFYILTMGFKKTTPRRPGALPTNVPRQGIAPREH